MAGVFPNLAAIAAVLVLAACQLSLPGGGAAPAAPDPVTGGAIEVTALDAAPSAKAAAVIHRPGPGTPRPRARPGRAAAPQPGPEAAAPVAAPKAAAPKSEAQLGCGKRGGRWIEIGKSGAFACVTPVKDAMKECTRGTQCEGDCLARSGSCAPYRPLFGCNEILDDSGRRMTQCLN
ncbi:MAG: hypothetical protein IAE87_03255 [Rhodobacteraceae bacterium]|jgi:hypothetical protein|nr:hypothetical protein [Paracoccaceae bacterium]